jgi:hypothetical protein
MSREPLVFYGCLFVITPAKGRRPWGGCLLSEVVAFFSVPSPFTPFLRL